jgi:adenylosuccinate synthase
VGHFDAVLARYALAVVAHAQAAASPDDGRSTSASARGIDSLIITCLDRLAGQTSLQLADGYIDQNGVLHRTLPLPPTSETTTQAAAQQTHFLQQLRPHYRALQSFSEPGLPAAAQAYLAAIGEELGVPVAAVSLGRTAQYKRNLSVGA